MLTASDRGIPIMCRYYALWVFLVTIRSFLVAYVVLMPSKGLSRFGGLAVNYVDSIFLYSILFFCAPSSLTFPFKVSWRKGLSLPRRTISSVFYVSRKHGGLGLFSILDNLHFSRISQAISCLGSSDPLNSINISEDPQLTLHSSPWYLQKWNFYRWCYYPLRKFTIRKLWQFIGFPRTLFNQLVYCCSLPGPSIVTCPLLNL